jgi:hypothetical protein
MARWVEARFAGLGDPTPEGGPMTIQRRNYLKLRRLLPNLDELQGDDHIRLGADGRISVSLIVRLCEGERRLLTFAHYSEINGDPVPSRR